MAISEPASSTAPGRFGRRAAGSFVSGTYRAPAMSVATATDTFT